MKKQSCILFIFAIFTGLILLSCKGNLTVKWWSSTQKKLWDEQRNLLLRTVDPSVKIDAEIFPDSVAQEIDGFGGSLSEAGWDALSVLDEKKRQRVLIELFDPNYGLKLNMCRIPIGANNYSISYFSLDDSIDDFALDYFTLERFKEFIVPYTKAIASLNKNIKVIAIPWTPPAWMKVNNHYACLSNKINGLKPELQGKEGIDQIKINDTVFVAYAKYFVKFIKELKDMEIEINSIQVQNEYNSCQVYPSCIWTTQTLKQFIGQFLGPQFEKNRIDAEIWFGTIERPDTSKIDSVINDLKCKEYIQGLGFQWGGKGVVAAIHAKYPSMRLMQTESEYGNGSNDWKAAENTFTLLKQYFDSGINSYLYGNLVLDETSKSRWGGKQNSLVTVNREKKDIQFNPELYLFKHFSHFLKEGSYKVLVKGKYADIIGFVTPSDDLVIILANNTDIPKFVRIKIGKKYIETVVAKHSFNTFLYYNAT